LAEVDVPVQAGITVNHGDIVLEISDLDPPTWRERLEVAKKIIEYNRKVRAACREEGVEFGDKHTPYHLWQINWRKVIGG